MCNSTKMCQEEKAFLVIIFNDYYSLFHLKKKSLVVGPYELPNKVQFIQRSPQLGIIRLAITASKPHFQTYSVQSLWMVPFPEQEKYTAVAPEVLFYQQSSASNDLSTEMAFNLQLPSSL